MSFVQPQYSKSQINKAGGILINPAAYSEGDRSFAEAVLTNWRASHSYPINTFQMTLRDKLKPVDKKALVAQRLKRAPSIVQKLKRFDGMKLARMQDIGGLRAVVSNVFRVRKLEASYRESRFLHELTSSKNYLDEPKADGYRGIHLIYRYENAKAPQYDGLSLELQIRTRHQHAWATAVETLGTFLGQALKSGQGEADWKTFFSAYGASLAITEKTNAVPGFESCSEEELRVMLNKLQKKLNIFDKLNGFTIAANKITEERGKGAYHLIILDSEARRVRILPFSKARLEEANEEYSLIEQRTKNGERIEAVLVSAGPISMLRQAYPNYFLDTQLFLSHLTTILTKK